MRITALLMLAVLTQVSAATFAQKITMRNKNASLRDIFEQIKVQTGYNVVVNSAELKNAKILNVNFNKLELEKVMDEILQPQNLEYVFNDKTIIVRAKEKSILDQLGNLLSADMSVQGRILDETGNPVTGATITLKGTKRAVISQGNGTFRLDNVEQGGILVISFTGYTTMELMAEADMGNITLKISESKLDQVQVIGYGTTTRRFNTGSVSTIKSEEIKNQTVISPIQALQGMVPGLFIQQGNGMPGAASQVSIRGKNSLTSGTVPLYIIDGVPFDGNPIERSGSMSSDQANGSSDPLNAINPSDIESIDVLKDADATSIYGARGANGVIIITTKYAKSGATTLNGSVFTGASKINNFVPVFSTAQFLAVRREAFANDNITPTTLNAPDLLLWDKNSDTDYQRYLMGKLAPQTEANISFSGGNSSTGLYISGSYREEGSVYRSDFKYQRGSLHAKSFHTSDNGKFRAEFSVIYSGDLNKMPASDIANLTTNYPNNYPLNNPDGTLYFHPQFNTNPLALLRNYGKNTAKTFVVNAALNYSFLSNLKMKINVGQNSLSQDVMFIYPSTAMNPTQMTVNGGGGNYTNNNSTTYIAEPQLDFNTQIANGKLNATLGGTYQFRDYKQPYYVAAGMFSSDALLENYTSAGRIYYQTSSSSQYRFASAFGRAVYNWDSKYILSGTFRRDGSSRFGPGKQYGTFGSIGAAWLFTSETFMKEVSWLSFGKVRGSYGTVGNDQIGDYGYLQTYDAMYTPYGDNPSIQPSGIENKELSWETTRKLEIAFELGFFNDKLMFNTAWFRNRSSDLLSYFPIGGQTGFTGYTANMDALVQNMGWEFELKASPISKGPFNWNLSFNISASNNKLLSYPGLAGSYNASRLMIGQSLNSLTLYQFTGFKDGIAQVADIDGDGQISPGLKANGMGDYIIAGNTDPKFYGGFSNNLKLGNFQLDVFLNFVNKDGLAPTSFPGLLKNQLTGVMNSGFKPSTNVGSASYSSYENYYVNSDAKVVDASFIRLRNVTLSYNLPEKWISKVKIKSCRIFASGQNLLTITNYKGFDPETLQYNPVGYPIPLPAPVFPPLRTITGGLQFSL
ncbi:SusC/RagA family TonB-linked outer membrane protein [Pedobacter psychroterrae]|nr:SusC/RagA family TonB-linked outer membrane protein [Pedobacter psychroterrae]